jgi:hypothetical protein
VNIVCDPQSIPELHTILDSDVIADHNVIFDEYLRADITVGADLCTRQYHAKLPDTRTFANSLALYV